MIVRVSLTYFLDYHAQDDMLYHAIRQYGCRWAVISLEVFKSRRPENQLKNRRNSAKFRRFVINKYGAAAFTEIDPKRVQGSDEHGDEPKKKKRRSKK